MSDEGTFAGFRRRRVLVQGASAGAAVSFVFTLHRFILEPGFGLRHVNVMGATAVMALAPLLFVKTGRYRLSAHLLVAGLSLALIIDSVVYGGIASPPVYAFYVVPLMATFFLGVKIGFGYGALMAGTLAVLGSLEGTGYLPPLPPPEALVQMRTVGSIGILAFVTLAAAMYEVERSRSMAQITAIIDHLVDGVLAADGEGTVQLENPAVRAVLGTSPGLGSKLPPELLELSADCLRSDAVESRELELPDGRVALALASPVRDRAAGVVVLVRDVTLARSVDKMKTDFIATASHELRTPMTSILGFAKLIRSKLEAHVLPLVVSDDRKVVKSVKQIRGNLDIVVAEGERLTALINDILDIAKMEAGRMEWQREEVDPRALVAQALGATASLFTGTEVTVESDVEEAPPLVWGDKNRLLQVLINLISNAAKFTDHGVVRIRARAAADGLELRVEDSGIGIPASELDAVFDRFRQIGDVATDRPKGTGLGLPICREIVQAHGGRIDVESEPGAGSTFIVRLPVGAPEA